MGLFSKQPKKPKEPDEPEELQQMPAESGVVVDLLNDAEKNVFAGYRENAAKIFAALKLKPGKNGLYSADQCQTAVTAWLEKDPRITSLELPVDEYSFAVGVSWGDFLNQQVGSVWVVLEDQYGNAYAVYKAASHGRSFPYQVAFKATSGEYGKRLIETATPTTLSVLNGGQAPTGK